MNWKATKRDEQNRIEQKAKQILGYDDESLIKEMDEAKAAWEAEKAANPEAEAQADLDADEGYKKLMARIDAESKFGAGRVGNVVKVEEIKAGKKWWRSRKALVLAAALGVFGIGMTVAATAEPGVKYETYPMIREQNKVYYRSSGVSEGNVDIEIAYEEIYKELGIDVMIFGYYPLEMKFQRVIIEKNRAILEFTYDNNQVFLQETKFPLDGEKSTSLKSDRRVCESVYNVWLNKYIDIESNELPDGITEYSSKIDVLNNYYYISGIMDIKEFEKIIVGLCYRKSQKGYNK